MLYYAPKSSLVSVREYTGKTLPLRRFIGESLVANTCASDHAVITSEGAVTLQIGDRVVKDAEGRVSVYTAEGFYTMFTPIQHNEEHT